MKNENISKKERKRLSELRVIKKNLLYVTHLSPSIASDEQLRKSQFFGQYGKIVEIVINKKNF